MPDKPRQIGEKQASSEIAQSREQFEKRGNQKSWNLKRRPDGSYDNPFTAYRWDDWQIAYAQAERDTRERVAQQGRSLLELVLDVTLQDSSKKNEILDTFERRIRGKE